MPRSREHLTCDRTHRARTHRFTASVHSTHAAMAHRIAGTWQVNPATVRAWVSVTIALGTVARGRESVFRMQSIPSLKPESGRQLSPSAALSVRGPRNYVRAQYLVPNAADHCASPSVRAWQRSQGVAKCQGAADAPIPQVNTHRTVHARVIARTKRHTQQQSPGQEADFWSTQGQQPWSAGLCAASSTRLLKYTPQPLRTPRDMQRGATRLLTVATISRNPVPSSLGHLQWRCNNCAAARSRNPQKGQPSLYSPLRHSPSVSSPSPPH